MKTKTAPKYIFAGIWLMMVALLGAMACLSHLVSGYLSAAIILIFAVIQMLLVLSFFMRLRYSGKLVRVFSAVGFLWLLIMVILTLSDYLTRQWH